MQFDVISIDWPWNFKVYNKDTGRGRSAAAHYDTDSLTWADWGTFASYVWPLMATNCALCIWMTRPSEDVAGEYVKYDWNAYIASQTVGFMYKRQTRFGTVLPRVADEIVYKTELFTLYKKYRDGTPFVGGGFYSRANTEPCKLYVRGNMPRTSKAVRQPIDYVPHDLDIPKEMRHSYKVPEYRRRIEQLWPGRRYLELFARVDAKEPGWTYLGNEVTGRDIREDMKDLARLKEETPDDTRQHDAGDTLEVLTSTAAAAYQATSFLVSI